MHDKYFIKLTIKEAIGSECGLQDKTLFPNPY